jgi:hypothetical protein
MFVFGTWDKHGPPLFLSAVTGRNHGMEWAKTGKLLQKDKEESAHTFSSIRNTEIYICI